MQLISRAENSFQESLDMDFFLVYKGFYELAEQSSNVESGFLGRNYSCRKLTQKPSTCSWLSTRLPVNIWLLSLLRKMQPRSNWTVIRMEISAQIDTITYLSRSRLPHIT